MRWEEVVRIHKSLGGVYIKDGKVLSILTSSDSHYGDQVSRDEIQYGISPYASKGEVAKAFNSALMARQSFHVFHKHSPGLWEYFGRYKAVATWKKEARSGGTIVYYRLVPASKREGKTTPV